ncbi:MAG TPA: hypothetical protein VGW34_09960 [Allosphingosinicella sp.]|nr:hypothetical protein [Allosphingosinicella sp.]
MSLDRCIPELLEAGRITPEQADRAALLYSRRKRHHGRSMGDAAAAAAAGEETAVAIERAALQAKRRALLQVKAQENLFELMLGYAGDFTHAARAFFDRDSRARDISNIEARRKAILGRVEALTTNILYDHRRRLWGALRNPAQMRDIVRELFGEDSGNLAARELADAWRQAAEMLRQRFNAAGGAIGKLDRWGLPQSHDSALVRRAAAVLGTGGDHFTAWRDFVAPKLDRGRMIDDATGQPFDDEALDAVLRDVFETIRSDGWAGREPGHGGGGPIGARRTEHRFLHFRAAGDWIDYQARFGSGNAFDAMTAHMHLMARDIAAMEILGPDPAASVRWLQDSLVKQAQIADDADSKAIGRAHKSSKVIGRLWDQYRGELGRPENRTMALIGSAFRSWQVSTKLGFAVLSAVGDIGFSATTRRFNGLPAAAGVADYAKTFNPLSAEHRKMAVRRGLMAEAWATATAAQHRYLLEELTGEVSRRLADGVLRASGLNGWTQNHRWLFGMEFADTLQSQFGKDWRAMEPALRRGIERYGFTADDWEVIRSTPLREEAGERWFFPQDVPDQHVGDRLLEMILTETDYAVPVADLGTKALMNSVAPAGTVIGEIARSGPLLFRSFGISVLLSHGRRALEQAGANKARYAAGLLIGVTIGGAVSLTLKEIAKGRDPRSAKDAPFYNEKTGEMEFNPGFWGAALVQGGGFGIFGDFFGAAAKNQYGQNLPETLAGVGPQVLQDAAALPTSETPLWDTIEFVKRETPFLGLWYDRLAFDRMVADQIQEQIDPNYRRSFRAIERYAADRGQDYWWGPGEAEPERSPDFANVLEESPQ